MVNGRTRAACLAHLPLPARALLPSHATLLTINRTRTAGPLDCVIPRSSRVPMPKSPLSQQLQAHARVCQLAPVSSVFFSPHRLPPRQSGTACLPLSHWVPRLVPVSPSSPLPLCLPTGVRGLWHYVQTQHDSSLTSKALPRFWRPLLWPLRPLRLAATTRLHHQTSADSPPATRVVICQPPRAHPRPLWPSCFRTLVQFIQRFRASERGGPFTNCLSLPAPVSPVTSAPQQIYRTQLQTSGSFLRPHHPTYEAPGKPNRCSMYHVADPPLPPPNPRGAQGRRPEAKGPKPKAQGPERFAAKRLRRST